MSAEEVRHASEEFYAALSAMLNGDATRLSGIWSHGETVTTMHPVGGRDVGWEQVRASWEQVAKLASDGKVELRDRLIQTFGDVAYEAGVEHARFRLAGNLVSAEIRVTNIYRKEGPAWKIIHHHTDLSQSMLDVLARLPPPG